MPYWVTYKDVVNFAAGKCVFVDTDEEQRLPPDGRLVEHHLTPRTQMVIINSPSNPQAPSSTAENSRRSSG